MKQFAEDNFKSGESGRQFSKKEEKATGKGELLVTSNVSLSHSVFKRFIPQTRKKQLLVLERVNQLKSVHEVVKNLNSVEDMGELRRLKVNSSVSPFTSHS